jgi:hypothetical protein
LEEDAFPEHAGRGTNSSRIRLGEIHDTSSSGAMIDVSVQQEALKVVGAEQGKGHFGRRLF